MGTNIFGPYHQNPEKENETFMTGAPSQRVMKIEREPISTLVNAIIPYAADCQTIGVYPYREAQSGNPRAVVGLTDLSARNNLKKQLSRNLFTFSVALRMFQEVEEKVEGSFFRQPVYISIPCGHQRPDIAEHHRRFLTNRPSSCKPP
jgi:hypothetical protein